MTYSSSFSGGLASVVAAALLSACGGATPVAEAPTDDEREAEPSAIPIADEVDPEPQRAPDPSPERHVVAEPEPESAADCCRGRNECKGLGGCAVEGANDCRGKNECKGMGGCHELTLPYGNTRRQTA